MKNKKEGGTAKDEKRNALIDQRQANDRTR
jgi:hypothetical protein